MAAVATIRPSSSAFQAYQVLHVGFTVAPILFGLDKFLNFMVGWTKYLWPVLPSTIGVTPRMFTYGVGVIEIIAGVGVFFFPRIFAWVVTAWLWGIIVNLLLQANFYDIALRDFGLSLGAISLARLSDEFWEGAGAA
jgi:hypothetical protein